MLSKKLIIFPYFHGTEPKETPNIRKLESN